MSEQNWAENSIEKTQLYRRASILSDDVWKVANRWSSFARDTVGIQLAKSVDSISANLVEGDGRGGGADSVRFFIISRASGREARHWICRAENRNMLSSEISQMWMAELTEIIKMINGLIRYNLANKDRIKEPRHAYGEAEANDPFTELILPSSLVP